MDNVMMALELAELSSKHVTEICRVADKYRADRNKVVRRAARTFLKTVNQTNFNDWEVPNG